MSIMVDQPEKFSILARGVITKISNAVWPIKASELVKFLPMAILMFMILLNQNIVRMAKDNLIVTMVGPEVINFIKLGGEMPVGFLFVVLYSVLCNHFSTEKLFRAIVLFFLMSFVGFAFLIFPYRDVLHPDPEYVQIMLAQYPYLHWFLIMWSKWAFILFYIMGELWPVIVFSLLFWQLANKVTKTEEASRFYALFALFGQSNLLISGKVAVYLASGDHCFCWLFPDVHDKSELMVKSLSLAILITGLICLALHYFIENRVMKDPTLYQPKTKSTEVLKLSLKESAKMVLGSRYLGLIAMIIICYCMASNLIEGLWFAKAKEFYKTPQDLLVYQGNLLFWTGIITLAFSLVGGTIIRNFGWYWGAILTPAIMLITGGMFFSFVILREHFDMLFGVLSIAPLQLIIYIGSIEHSLNKGVKYSLCDATKEMAYIPLDDEMKTKGKASVDVVGAKIGKSAGAFLQILVFTYLPGAKYDDLAGFLMVLFTGVCLVWLLSVKLLRDDYTAALRKQQK